MKTFKILLAALLFSASLFSQSVGINSDGSTPNSSAMLDVMATNKGFLPPRVALTGTADATTIVSPAAGLFVYNTATAGTSPSNVIPGLYYYDGSKWQRIINQQPDATVEFDKATPTTAGVVFTPNNPASKDYVYVSTTDNSQWTYNGTTYVTYTPPASTAWNLSGGTTDAGSNKTAGIYRAGNVGIGTTTPNASAKLDVTSTTQGFLPPRVALNGTTDATTIKNAAGTSVTPATGLLVYNTATTSVGTNDVTPGYYYYNGSKWAQLAIASVSNTYQLAATATASVINTQQTYSDGNFGDVTNSSMTVTIPTGYTSRQVVIRWDMWGDVTSSDNSIGSLRFQIVQSGSASATIGNVMMTSWARIPAPSNQPRWSAPVSYVISGLNAGTYSFKLQMRREGEAGTVTSVNVFGVSGLAQVFVK